MPDNAETQHKRTYTCIRNVLVHVACVIEFSLNSMSRFICIVISQVFVEIRMHWNIALSCAFYKDGLGHLRIVFSFKWKVSMKMKSFQSNKLKKKNNNINHYEYTEEKNHTDEESFGSAVKLFPICHSFQFIEKLQYNNQFVFTWGFFVWFFFW